MSGILGAQKGGKIGYWPKADVLGVPECKDVLDYLGQSPPLQTPPLTGVDGRDIATRSTLREWNLSQPPAGRQRGGKVFSGGGTAESLRNGHWELGEA